MVSKVSAEARHSGGLQLWRGDDWLRRQPSQICHKHKQQFISHCRRQQQSTHRNTYSITYSITHPLTFGNSNPKSFTGSHGFAQSNSIC